MLLNSFKKSLRIRIFIRMFVSFFFNLISSIFNQLWVTHNDSQVRMFTTKTWEFFPFGFTIHYYVSPLDNSFPLRFMILWMEDRGEWMKFTYTVIQMFDNHLISPQWLSFLVYCPNGNRLCELLTRRLSCIPYSSGWRPCLWVYHRPQWGRLFLNVYPSDLRSATRCT